ncbi:DUF4391 domain-containing protein [Frateuria sp. YIM B11624]|uniref:DUF4391 domain-containing protein n=1 Tax=Frateuria sp. YIM B11624 TaxID=3143185 RepID=UPI003C74CD0F
MKVDAIVDALQLPPASWVDQRIAKKLLIEHGAPTAADRRLIQDGVEETTWLAALKPELLGTPPFRDVTREYLEIALVRLRPREGAHFPRLTELVHRAIPYPVLLLVEGPASGVSLAHKRQSQAEAEKVVLDGEPVGVDVGDHATDAAFLQALALSLQPNASLFALYQGWMDAVIALQAAQHTGRFQLATSADQAQARRTALAAVLDLQARIQQLDKAARSASQMARQVELNIALQQARQQLADARARL